MLDILLTPDGDLEISDTGDIALTNSVRQAVKIRLQWYFKEWRFAPEYGVPYLEEVFVKNPNVERIKMIVREEAVSVDEVLDARNVKVEIDKRTRKVVIGLDIVTEEGVFREEVMLNV